MSFKGVQRSGAECCRLMKVDDEDNGYRLFL